VKPTNQYNVRLYDLHNINNLGDNVWNAVEI
jgi:hypothetical protein